MRHESAGASHQRRHEGEGEGHHHRLGSRVHEADALERRGAAAELPGELDLDLGRHGEGGAPLCLVDERRDHRRMGMAVDQ